MENPAAIDQLETPLHKAITNGNLQEVHALIEKGINLDSKDAIGKTPKPQNPKTPVEI